MIDKNSPFKLFVEGKDDLAVVTHVVARHDPLLAYHVIEHENPDENPENRYHGIERIVKKLQVRLKIADFRALGIMVDADYSESGAGFRKRWDAFRRILSAAGYEPPDGPSTAGLVLEKDGRHAGVWIMPNNTDDGMLENFIGSLISSEDTLWPRATHCVDSIPLADRKFAEIHRQKALAHTWLAWQKDPGKPFGVAIQKKYLDATSAPAKALYDWLGRLFA